MKFGFLFLVVTISDQRRPHFNNNNPYEPASGIVSFFNIFDLGHDLNVATEIKKAELNCLSALDQSHFSILFGKVH